MIVESPDKELIKTTARDRLGDTNGDDVEATARVLNIETVRRGGTADNRVFDSDAVIGTSSTPS